jgi:hypothetical protein
MVLKVSVDRFPEGGRPAPVDRPDIISYRARKDWVSASDVAGGSARVRLAALSVPGWNFAAT